MSDTKGPEQNENTDQNVEKEPYKPPLRRKFRRIKSYTARGAEAFTLTQAKMRVNLCKETLGCEKYYKIRFKNIYSHSGATPEEYAITQFPSENGDILFDSVYDKIFYLAWGGEFCNFWLDDHIPVGSFWPFVRYSSSRSPEILDQGCIWMGGKDSYPRIHVANKVCKWWFPIDWEGYIQFHAFLPQREMDYSTVIHKGTLKMLEDPNRGYKEF